MTAKKRTNRYSRADGEKPEAGGRIAENYRYPDPEFDSPMRPEVGTQAQFKKKKPPQTYRYDSSLSPALDWDGQNPAREQGEALIRNLLDAGTLEEAKAAAEKLKALGKPFLNWAGKAERLSFDVPTLPLFVHERLSTKAILETLKSHKRDKQMPLFDLFSDPQHSVADQVLRAYEHRDKWTNRMILGDFGLIDAIESGLVKIPQLAIRDTTGAEIPGYFNIWHWILPQLTPAERGGKKASPKPEAILKYAHHPFAMLGSLWHRECEEWARLAADRRPPVFILVCKNTQIARVIYEWLAEDKAPVGIPPVKIDGFRNNGGINTIRVDSKVVHETDTGQARSDESRWMRFTLDTVGKNAWPADRQGRPIYPRDFEDLAKKLGRPLHPPGRDVRCIVSVGMLTEGWDCNTVTHIIGLRPFMSQLLCEQVVGRGLRRTSYDAGEDGRFNEEVAKVFGVPFEVIPFKSNKQAAPAVMVKRRHVHAVPAKSEFEILFPRVEGYTQRIQNRIAVNWNNIPPLFLEPGRIPPEVEVKALSVSNEGRLSLFGPGRIDDVTLREFRAQRRMQELVFDLARGLARHYLAQGHCEIPPHALFPQLVRITDQYVDKKVHVQPPADKKDLFLAPYYGWLVERLVEAIGPDTSQGESPEVPIYESSRGPGSTSEVDFWTSREVREVVHSHVNYVVADTRRWEQSAAYILDKHQVVSSFVKNAGLGFAIPYLLNGQMHDYQPDFIVRMKSNGHEHLIFETKGFDPLGDVKRAAAERWVAAVNAEGSFGRWHYGLARKIEEIPQILDSIAGSATNPDSLHA